MALSDPRSIYGVHTWTPYDRDTGEFFGTVRVLGSAAFSPSGELVELNGGSQRYSWDVEDGGITAEMSLTLREYPDFLFELFLGKAPTSNSAEASGNVSSLSNVKGTSVEDATTGIASIAAKSGSEADMKFGKYIVKAVSETTVDVFASSNVDFQNGTSATYENDALKINASPLTVTDSGGTTTITDFGLEITGGSGTVSMTTGDTAEFYVRPVNDESMEVDIGGSNDVYPEFGSLSVGQRKSNGEMVEIEIYRAKAIGLPLPMNEKAYGESEVTVKAFYDSGIDKVATVRHVDAS